MEELRCDAIGHATRAKIALCRKMCCLDDNIEKSSTNHARFGQTSKNARDAMPQATQSLQTECDAIGHATLATAKKTSSDHCERYTTTQLAIPINNP